MSQDGPQGGGLGAPSRTARSARRGRRRAITRSVVGLVLLLVLSLVGYAVFQYLSLSMGIKRSDVLGGIKKSNVPAGAKSGDTNILIMGLDSRLDENGDALHAGDQSNGGLNANVLMLLHVPGDGSKATEISIPRDDYVHLAGCPDGECM